MKNKKGNTLKLPSNKSSRISLKSATEYLKADEEMKSKRYTSAIQIINNILKSNPNDWMAFEARSRCKFHSDDVEGALKDSEQTVLLINEQKVILTAEEQTDIYFFNGMVNALLRQYVKAEKILADVIMLDNNHDGAHLFYGFNEMWKGNIENAIKAFTNVLRINPNDDEAYATRGFCYATKNDSVRAVADFEKISNKLNDSQSIVMSGKGLLSWYNNNPYQALSYFDEAIKLEPSDPYSFLIRGIVKLELRDPSAEEDFVNANKAFKPMAGQIELAFYYHIGILIQNKQIDRARVIAEKALEKFPLSSKIWESLSSIQFNAKDLSNAIGSANRSIELEKLNENAWLNRILSKIILGDNQGAEKDVQEAFEIFGDTTLVYRLRALRESKDESALSHIENGLSIEPKDPGLLSLKGMILYFNGEKEIGMNLFSEAFKNGGFLTEYENRDIVESLIVESKTANDKKEGNDLLKDEHSYIFRRDGDLWFLRYNGGDIITMKHSVGLYYIKMVLMNPHGEGIHSSVLINGNNDRSELEITNDVQDKSIPRENRKNIDETALNNYKNKLKSLIREKEAIIKDGYAADYEIRFEEVENKIEQIQKQIKGYRFNVVDPDDNKASNAVRNAINRVRDQIKQKDPAFSEHLCKSIATGLHVIYRPATDISWQL